VVLWCQFNTITKVVQGNLAMKFFTKKVVFVFLSLTLTTSVIGNSPKLSQLFGENPTARFESVSESEKITVNYFDVAHKHDLKFKLFSYKGSFYSYVRVIRNKKKNGIVLMKGRNSDGVVFDQVGGYLFNNLYKNGDGTWHFYDPHVSTKRVGNQLVYIMTMECANQNGLPGAFGPSVCMSESKDPTNMLSWTTPRLVVKTGHHKSASTAVSVSSGRDTYLSWTLLDDGKVSNVEDGNESASSKISKVNYGVDSRPIYMGVSNNVGKYVLKAKSDTRCTLRRGSSTWDCNNLDIQDFHKEGSYYYAIYNGGNFFRCTTPKNRNMTNNWALSMRRSKNIMGAFNDSAGVLINNINNSKCGISYPTINIINGKTYMYYSYYDETGAEFSGRSQLIRGKSSIRKFKSTKTFVSTKNDRCDETIQSAFSYWLSRYATNGELIRFRKKINKIGLKKSLKIILFSGEGFRASSKRSVQQNVSSLYHSTLRRAPDNRGLKFYSSLLRNNSNNVDENILNRFLDSKEFSSVNKGLRCY